jgi:hypothetical protein
MRRHFVLAHVFVDPAFAVSTPVLRSPGDSTGRSLHSVGLRGRSCARRHCPFRVWQEREPTVFAQFPLSSSVAFEPNVLSFARFDLLNESQTPQEVVLALDAIPAESIELVLCALAVAELVAADFDRSVGRDERLQAIIFGSSDVPTRNAWGKKSSVTR